MLNVPSGFLYHPSKAGVTPCPDAFTGERGNCARVARIAADAPRTRQPHTISRRQSRICSPVRFLPPPTFVRRRGLARGRPIYCGGRRIFSLNPPLEEDPCACSRRFHYSPSPPARPRRRQ